MITIAWPMAKPAQSYPQITQITQIFKLKAESSPVKSAALGFCETFNRAGKAQSYPQITQTRLRSDELRRGRLHRYLSSKVIVHSQEAGRL